ncbi:hypothetical protein AB5I41_06015 [Sphingomonas sp. MMS24-JH45]
MASVVQVSEEAGERLDRMVASGSYPSREAAVAEGILAASTSRRNGCVWSMPR